MKERNNLMGAWGFQDAMAELGGRALLPAIQENVKKTASAKPVRNVQYTQP